MTRLIVPLITVFWFNPGTVVAFVLDAQVDRRWPWVVWGVGLFVLGVLL